MSLLEWHVRSPRRAWWALVRPPATPFPKPQGVPPGIPERHILFHVFSHPLGYALCVALDRRS